MRTIIKRVFEDEKYCQVIIRPQLEDLKKMIPVSKQEAALLIKEVKQAFYRKINIGKVKVLGKLYEGLYIAISDRYVFYSVNDLFHIEVYYDKKDKIFNLIDELSGEIRQSRIKDL